MPIPNVYKDICEMLLNATLEHRVNWIANLDDSFTVRLPDFIFQMWGGIDKRRGRFVGVTLLDRDTQEAIDYWRIDSDDEDIQLLEELLSSARREAHKIPDKLQKLRAILKKGGKIGGSGESSSE